MSIEYSVIQLQAGADLIYMGVAHRTLWHRLRQLFA